MNGHIPLAFTGLRIIIVFTAFHSVGNYPIAIIVLKLCAALTITSVRVYNTAHVIQSNQGAFSVLILFFFYFNL